MKMDWKCLIVAFIVLSTVFAFTVTTAYAARGGEPGSGGMQGGERGAAGGVKSTGGQAGVKTGGGMQTAGGGNPQVGMGSQGGQAGVRTGGGMAGQAGQQVGQGTQQGRQFTGTKPQGGFQGGERGAGERGMGERGIGERGGFQGGERGIGERGGFQGGERGIGERGMGERGGFEGRNFDRGQFFGGKDYNSWRHSHQHRYWNGNSWVFGIQPTGFIAVPVPVSSCPYSPEMFAGNPNACFFTCVDNGYDPLNVCNICCGTNY